MKKISFALFLLCIIVLPFLILYVADKDGVITNPTENESEFINFISPEAIKTLTVEEKAVLSERFTENAVDLHKTRQEALSNDYKDGSFFCVFYNDISQDDNWFEFSLGRQSKDIYFSFRLKTGLYEKLSFLKHTGDDVIVLFRNYIPLLYNKFNSLQVDVVDGHILFLLNRKLIFHLLLEEKSAQGGIGFESNTKDIKFIRQVMYSPIPEHIKTKMKSAIDKIPFNLLRN